MVKLDRLMTNCVGAGSSWPKLEQLGEHRDDPDQQHGGDAGGDGDDGRRVDHGALDLRLQLHGLFHVDREALKDGVEDTADLAGGDHVDEQVVEDLVVLAQRLGEGRAGFDVVLQLADDAAEFLVLGLARQDVEALDDRQTGVDHRAELTGEDDDVARLHLLAQAGEGDLAVEALAALADLRGNRLDALGAQAGQHRVAGRRLHLAADRLAAR
jgi:hypothetical protein